MSQPSHLQKFYDDRVRTLSGDDFLAHVGHTEQGKAISDEHLGIMVAHIENALSLEASDSVLELCCGNGLIANILSPRVKCLVGIDFSPRLIQVAETHHHQPNIQYAIGDVTKLTSLDQIRDMKFSKVFMNASLQHFHPSSFGELLDGIAPYLAKDAVIVLSCVPLKGRERVLFSSFRKRLQRAYLKLTNKDIFGHWWSGADIRKPAEARGLEFEEVEIPSALFFSEYRFTAKLRLQTD